MGASVYHGSVVPDMPSRRGHSDAPRARLSGGWVGHRIVFGSERRESQADQFREAMFSPRRDIGLASH